MFAVKKLLIFIALFIGKQAYANGSAQFNCNQTTSELINLNLSKLTIAGFKKSGSDKIAKYENESADVTWLESGKIKLEQSYYIKNVKLLICSPGSKIDRDWHLMSYSEEFHPFEFVRIVYTDAETISKRGITEEVVPAFVALMIRENIERQKTFYYARQVGNAVAMAAAVFAAPITGGGSLAAWATVTYGVLSAVDAYVIYERRNSYDPSNEQFYKNWDQFKTLADIGAIGITAGAGLYNVASQVQLLGPKVFVVQTLKAWSNTIKAGKSKIVNIVEQTKKLPKQIVQAFKGYYGEGDWVATLKTNSSYTAYVDGLVSGSIVRKFSNILTVEEEAVLKFYTTNIGYKDFNRALRGEIPFTDFYKAQKNLMEQALSKLPNSTYNSGQNLLFRIENLTETQIAEIYVEGSIVNTKAFTSSTYSEKAIIDAMRNRPYTVLIRIEGKNGKLIEDVSTLPSEMEILFKTGTKFKVEKVGFESDPSDPLNIIKSIWIKEI